MVKNPSSFSLPPSLSSPSSFWFSFFFMVIVIYISYLINENRMMWRRRAHVCHEYHELYSWRKNCHVEKFQLSMYDNCVQLKISPHVETFQHNWWGFIAVYVVVLLNLLFTLFCREIFATIYARSCGENLSPKVHLWRKNDKYEVYPQVANVY